MSLLIAARYRDGTLVASDPFVFDNDRLRPSRRLDFERFYVAAGPRVLFASVGSRWVFKRFCLRVEAEGAFAEFARRPLGSLWKALCTRWKEQRAQELAGQGRESHRAVSDSLLLAVPCGRPERIAACTAAGKWTTSRTFVVTGSAAHWVRAHLVDRNNRFDLRDTLDDCLRKVQTCFAVGARDLYVFGLPAIAIVTPDAVVNLSTTSREIWQRLQEAGSRALRRRTVRAMSFRPGA